jgi:cellulose synthase/poly-beta-1,6-N-acetylglucosamine synthase-like glycosyltransferase
MGVVVSWLLVISAGAVAFPAMVLAIEILSSLLRRQVPQSSIRDDHQRIAVLVPARDECAGITATLDDIKAQLLPTDRLVVVADNCSDDTAAVARTAGAEVVERNDLEHIGKGYALDYGLRYLEKDPPDIVVMVDADCRLARSAIDRLASACAATGRPVQALYLMTASDESKINHQVAEFAWRVKNWVRPLGLGGLNLPCPLMGAGMAFPWEVIRGTDLASGWIVEDLKLGLDLAAAGHPPLFCPSALVLSHFASSARGAKIQRRRWEHGHIVTILKKAPNLLRRAVTCRNFDLLGLTLDLLVPPLSLLASLLVLMFLVSGLTKLLGFGSAALIVSATSLGTFAISIGLAWNKYGREVLPSRSILSIPGYVLSKLGLYRQVLFGKMTADWIGTDRGKP